MLREAGVLDEPGGLAVGAAGRLARDVTGLSISQARYLCIYRYPFSHSPPKRRWRAGLHPSVFAFGFESEVLLESEELLESDELFESEDELLDSEDFVASLCASFSRERLRVP
jgi:hypothetical protein